MYAKYEFKDGNDLTIKSSSILLIPFKSSVTLKNLSISSQSFLTGYKLSPLPVILDVELTTIGE